MGQSSQVAQPFYDVNRDGFISPIDALQVINYLNKPATVEHKAATLPSGDPAAVLPMPMRPLGTPSIAKNVPRAEHPSGEVAGRLFDPFASGLFTPVAGADTVGASVKPDIWSAPDRDWILGGFEPAITALADGLAGKSDVHDDLRDQLFSVYDRPLSRISCNTLILKDSKMSDARAFHEYTQEMHEYSISKMKAVSYVS